MDHEKLQHIHKYFITYYSHENSPQNINLYAILYFILKFLFSQNLRFRICVQLKLRHKKKIFNHKI